MLVGLLHLPRRGRPVPPGGRLTEAVPSGSYLAMSHLAIDIMPEAMEAAAVHLEAMEEPWIPRTHAGVAKFFEGLEPVEPGVVQVDEVAQPRRHPRRRGGPTRCTWASAEALSRPARPAPRRVDEVSASDRPPPTGGAAARSCAGAGPARGQVLRHQRQQRAPQARRRRPGARSARGSRRPATPPAGSRVSVRARADCRAVGLPCRPSPSSSGSPPPRACGPPASRTGPRTAGPGQPRIGGRVLGGHALAVAPLLDEGPQQVGLGREVVVDRGDVEAAGRRQPAHRRRRRPARSPAERGVEDPRWPAVRVGGVGEAHAVAAGSRRRSGVNTAGRLLRASTRLESPRSRGRR